MSAPFVSATAAMDELVCQLGANACPCERVIDAFRGPISGTGTADSPETRPIHSQADRAIEELRISWGPTTDPQWVADLLPDRREKEDSTEFDCLFALFRRTGVWAYVRLRALNAETTHNAQLRLIFGVVRAKESDI